MNAIPTVSGRPNEASPDLPLSTRARGNPNNDVVRVTAADVLPPANLPSPTAQTFDELEIPADFRAAVEKALTADEKMLWIGRPSRNRQVHPSNSLPSWVGIGLIVLAGVIFVAVLGSAVVATQRTSLHVFGCIFASVLGLIGSAIVFLPKLNKPESWCRYCYVVTNRRALLIEQAAFGINRRAICRSSCWAWSARPCRGRRCGRPGLRVHHDDGQHVSTRRGKTGAFLQQARDGPISSTRPQRVLRGLRLSRSGARWRTSFASRCLLQLENALDGRALCVQTACSCGLTIEAPIALAGKSLKCPRCAAVVALPVLVADHEVARFLARKTRFRPTSRRNCARAWTIARSQSGLVRRAPGSSSYAMASISGSAASAFWRRCSGWSFRLHRPGPWRRRVRKWGR